MPPIDLDSDAQTGIGQNTTRSRSESYPRSPSRHLKTATTATAPNARNADPGPGFIPSPHTLTCLSCLAAPGAVPDMSVGAGSLSVSGRLKLKLQAAVSFASDSVLSLDNVIASVNAAALVGG